MCSSPWAFHTVCRSRKKRKNEEAKNYETSISLGRNSFDSSFLRTGDDAHPLVALAGKHFYFALVCLHSRTGSSLEPAVPVSPQAVTLRFPPATPATAWRGAHHAASFLLGFLNGVPCGAAHREWAGKGLGKSSPVSVSRLPHPARQATGPAVCRRTSPGTSFI